jgi:hypothetical protein
MRLKRDRKPRWKILNLIVLLVLGSLILETSLHLTPLGHKITLFLLVIAVYGLIGGWVKANTAALEDLDAEKYQEQSRDPALYGTRGFPTRTQARFRQALSLYRHETPDQ